MCSNTLFPGKMALDVHALRARTPAQYACPLWRTVATLFAPDRRKACSTRLRALLSAAGDAAAPMEQAEALE